MRVGSVAVPFGTCTELSNVKAGGHACPFRFRCLGCGHFRTDPSYLPELRDYLQTLLANRERILAATDLDDWAAAEAAPSEEEITRLRVLIRRTEEAVDGLGPAEQTALLEATTALRTVRRVHLGMPGIAPPQQDSRLGGTRYISIATVALTDSRRRDSASRRQRVVSALDRLAAAGDDLSVSAVARAARVHRSFIYRHGDLHAAVGNGLARCK